MVDDGASQDPAGWESKKRLSKVSVSRSKAVNSQQSPKQTAQQSAIAELPDMIRCGVVTL